MMETAEERAKRKQEEADTQARTRARRKLARLHVKVEHAQIAAAQVQPPRPAVIKQPDVKAEAEAEEDMATYALEPLPPVEPLSKEEQAKLEETAEETLERLKDKVDPWAKLRTLAKEKDEEERNAKPDA